LGLRIQPTRGGPSVAIGARLVKHILGRSPASLPHSLHKPGREGHLTAIRLLLLGGSIVPLFYKAMDRTLSGEREAVAALWDRTPDALAERVEPLRQSDP